MPPGVLCSMPCCMAGVEKRSRVGALKCLNLRCWNGIGNAMHLATACMHMFTLPSNVVVVVEGGRQQVWCVFGKCFTVRRRCQSALQPGGSAQTGGGGGGGAARQVESNLQSAN